MKELLNGKPWLFNKKKEVEIVYYRTEEAYRGGIGNLKKVQVEEPHRGKPVSGED